MMQAHVLLHFHAWLLLRCRVRQDDGGMAPNGCGTPKRSLISACVTSMGNLGELTTSMMLLLAVILLWTRGSFTAQNGDQSSNDRGII